MVYQPIVGTLGYVLSEDRKKVLMIHRNKRKGDDHLGKYNGLGGKMEPNEDLLSSMKREIREEANIECLEISLRGSINWTGFGKNGEDWLGFVFLITKFSGTPSKSNPEGTLEWIDLDQLDYLPMWDGDRHFLPLVFDQDPRPFHAYMPYQGTNIQSWSYERY